MRVLPACRFLVQSAGCVLAGVGLVLGLGACVAPRPASRAPANPALPGGIWGRYSGPIRTEWEPGRNMRLLEDVHYVGPDGRDWLAPKTAEIDGASIPQEFWSIVGGPYEGTYRDASVFHDVACVRRAARWQDVHYMFYTAMRCSGVEEERAKIMYAAVYRFGPRWPDPMTGGHPRVRAFGAAAPTPVLETTPRAPTPAEAREVAAWVRQNHPSLQRIEQTSAIPGAPAVR